jgi:hypothetical protein
MSVYGGWKTATIALNGTTSGEVDLGAPSWDYLQVIIPTIDSGTIKVQVSDVAGGTYQDLGDDVTTNTTTGGYSTVFRLGGWQHVKIVTSSTQTAAREFKIRGMRF